MTRREFGAWAKTNSHVVTRDMDTTRVIDLNIVQNIKTIGRR
jgi:hypothetical protein